MVCYVVPELTPYLSAISERALSFSSPGPAMPDTFPLQPRPRSHPLTRSVALNQLFIPFCRPWPHPGNLTHCCNQQLEAVNGLNTLTNGWNPNSFKPTNICTNNIFQHWLGWRAQWCICFESPTTLSSGWVFLFLWLVIIYRMSQLIN